MKPYDYVFNGDQPFLPYPECSTQLFFREDTPVAAIVEGIVSLVPNYPPETLDLFMNEMVEHLEAFQETSGLNLLKLGLPVNGVITPEWISGLNPVASLILKHSDLVSVHDTDLLSRETAIAIEKARQEKYFTVTIPIALDFTRFIDWMTSGHPQVAYECENSGLFEHLSIRQVVGLVNGTITPVSDKRVRFL